MTSVLMQNHLTGFEANTSGREQLEKIKQRMYMAANLGLP